jgi:trehalose utilization protein
LVLDVFSDHYPTYPTQEIKHTLQNAIEFLELPDNASASAALLK